MFEMDEDVHEEVRVVCALSSRAKLPVTELPDKNSFSTLGGVKQQSKTAKQPAPTTNAPVHKPIFKVPYAAAPNKAAAPGAMGHGQAASTNPPKAPGASGTSGGGQGGRTWPCVEGFNPE